jgi:hypothetical protein
MICSQPPCINMAVIMVIRFRPAAISDGMNDHRTTKAGPFTNSSRNMNVFAPMIRIVMSGKREGLRSISLNGIIHHLGFCLSAALLEGTGRCIEQRATALPGGRGP